MTDIPAENIPIEIRSYLLEIAQRLWSGHAAVMVGAGFSKNGLKSDPTKRDIPNWNQLGDIFYEKIYGCKPNIDQHYLNVMKLANEVQAAFGRPVLDQIMREYIPDKEYEPSSLHSQLLELPWTDIFTTNYDTLLERASVNVINQRFDVVVSKQDLIYSKKPRIIKLHGSFPYERPLIVTEEDYRTYPNFFAPFVNTVQQSLLENTLCLLGFSGDDPNFLQWIGWINDNLGRENSPKIYLVGLLGLSDAQKKLLESKNIVLVDLALCKETEGSHSKALSIFLNFLKSEKKKGNNLEWPGNIKFTPNLNDNFDFLTIIEEWKSDRLKYPNWLILPEEQREVLWKSTEGYIKKLFELEKVDNLTDLNFCYELNWRLERCLCPLFNDLVPVIERVINKYDPKIGENTTNQNTSRKEDLVWDNIKSKWLDLQLSLLRFYREENIKEKWDNTTQLLNGYFQHFSPEQIARFYYEQSLFEIFQLNIYELQQKLAEWPQNVSLPYWEAKRAALFGEIGKGEEAEKVLETSLTFIRARLNLSPVLNDYTWVSQEAYVIVLLKYIRSCLRFASTEYKSENEEVKKLNQERLSDLVQYKCDPWNEFKLFRIKLEQEPVNRREQNKKRTFDIGRTTTTYNLTYNENDTFTAYSFLRFVEEAGIPFRVSNVTYEKKTVEAAARRISLHSPNWALAVLLRLGDTKVVDNIFTRLFVFKMKPGEADELIDHYILAFHQIQQKKLFNLSSSIPEILSRLTVRCSDQSKIKILEFLKQLYLSDQKRNFTGISNLLKRVLASSSSELQSSILVSLLDFPLLDQDHIGFPEPFYFINFGSGEIDSSKVRIKKDIIISLLIETSEEGFKRKMALLRLGKLYELKLLDKNQSKSFGKALWMFKDAESELPSDSPFYLTAYLHFPHPKNNNIINIIKNYILHHPFPLENTESKKGKGIAITNGNIQILEEVNRGLSTTELQWSDEEVLSLFHKIVEWWECDKSYLKKEDTNPLFSISDEFVDRFEHINTIIATIIKLHHKSIINSGNQINLVQLIDDLQRHQVSYLLAKTAYTAFFGKDKKRLINDIERSFASKQDRLLNDAAKATLSVVEFYKLDYISDAETIDVLSIISHQIKWRISRTLTVSLEIMSNILDKYPQIINEGILSDLLVGLEHLLNETDLRNTAVDESSEEKLIFRKYGTRLAAKLQKHYNKENLPLPQVVTDWQTTCRNTQEFEDIKREWVLL
ncbi:anti-phage defense-associated sirtuin Dsr2 [Pontibacter mangrovi]|uniref:SIR2 family protein n=1 Tax=Pontibacter mangrovi TaxID=2589816 RepID=A0A501W230_9BACT|nr:anti-phage defense-associated sirtuin Dsr2 [Pontibacter mangrovi]TPE43318.1 SIR2 family protein [Pontibacter mangrovi]